MAEPTQALPLLLRVRFGPALLVFLTSVCVMTLEIAAGRLIARNLGSSLYTWTSVIGVVLAGLALGNYLGGRMTERFEATHLLGSLFIASAIATASVPVVDIGVVSTHLFEGLVWPLRVALTVAAEFLLPSAVLGTIGPVVMKAALDLGRSRPGHTIGNVYAAGAFGSIVGTFASGFFLLGVLGTRSLIWATAGVLGALALTVVRTSGRQLAAVTLSVVSTVVAASTVQARGWVIEPDSTEPPQTYQVESDYFDIEVVPRERFGGASALRYPGSRVLILDAMVHGFVVPGHPERLEYDYERLTAQLTARVLRGSQAALFIGGGAYTFPRYYEVTYPGARLDVVEIDPAVTEAVHAAMDLPRTTRIRSIHQDARVYVRALTATSTGTYDVVYGDAFNGFSVPWHLTTREFDADIRQVLRPGGAYILNLIDSQASERFVGASYCTLKEVFRHVTVFGMSGSQNRETYVILASDAEVDLQDLREPDGSPLRAYRLDEARLARIAERAGGMVLTDDFAPVDLLTAPIYQERRKF